MRSEGSLVLFSSRRQMLEVFQGIDGAFRWLILMQGDYSKQEILRRHREAIDAGRAVLFSAWPVLPRVSICRVTTAAMW